MKKVAFPLLLVALFLTIWACNSEPAASSATADTYEPDGSYIYRQNCVVCHGADGKLGLSGAKDLSQSKLTLDDRVLQITNGKNMMTPFKGILKPNEIRCSGPIR
ncbi:MAG: c-type cytochrome [Lewinellaceae bacterium]|nr:c-type cytochrome [Lewinellaceae bacterium]